MLVFACLLGGSASAEEATTGAATAAGFTQLAGHLLPAVVNISTSQTIKAETGRRPDAPDAKPESPFEQFFKDFMQRQGQDDQGDDDTPPDTPAPEPQPRKSQSLGSGFIIDPSGLIVTNNHVIADADEITVILQGDISLKAELVGRDADTDLALLRVKADHPLPSVKFGDSDETRVGDWVMAIGNPYGLGGTVTAGILSARSREINNSGPYDDFLQTDASINRGNSGGPLFNLAGEVIGINSAIFSPSGGSVGIGFAIPSTLARHIIQQLRDYGHVKRGWMGIRMQSVNEDVAPALGLDAPKGALIAAVIDKGPAQRAGIQPGDVILDFGGKEVTDARRLQRLVDDAPLDQPVTLKVWRKRGERQIDVRIAELSAPEEAAAETGKPDDDVPAMTKALGLSLTEATQDLRDKYQLSDAAAVVVTDIDDAAPAAKSDIKVGDAVMEVAEVEVEHPDDVVHLVAEARKAGRKSILFLVERAGELHFVALKIADRGVARHRAG